MRNEPDYPTPNKGSMVLIAAHIHCLATILCDPRAVPSAWTRCSRHERSRCRHHTGHHHAEPIAAGRGPPDDLEEPFAGTWIPDGQLTP